LQRPSPAVFSPLRATRRALKRTHATGAILGSPGRPQPQRVAQGGPLWRCRAVPAFGRAVPGPSGGLQPQSQISCQETTIGVLVASKLPPAPRGSGAITVPSCAFGPLCAIRPRGQGASVWRRRRSLKLTPLGFPKTTASAAQAPTAPPSGGSKRPPSPGGPPPAMPARAQQHNGARFCHQGPRQPEQNSTAGFAFTERARWQPEGATARRRVLLHGATSTARAQQHGALPQSGHGATSTARAQQHGGVRFCRSAHGSQGTAARRRALLSGATSTTRDKQHGGGCFHRARRVGPGPPPLSL
jgi:hypothetical protein